MSVLRSSFRRAKRPNPGLSYLRVPLASIPGEVIQLRLKLLAASTYRRDLGKRLQVSRQAASGPQPAQHAEPPKHRRRSPGHERRPADSARIWVAISTGVYSGKLVEVRASALVSDAADATMPVQPASRESRLAGVRGSAVRRRHR
jgi:hypothetical protein